jgi:hypothetical protein
VDQALEFIRQDREFTQPENVDIDLGRVTVSEVHRVLASLGYVEVTQDGESTRVVLTDRGRAAALGWRAVGDSEGARWRIPVRTRRLIEVGRVTSSPHLVEVGFAWRWIPVGDIGVSLAGEGPVRRSSVAFWRYEDGWRMTPIDF